MVVEIEVEHIAFESKYKSFKIQYICYYFNIFLKFLNILLKHRTPSRRRTSYFHILSIEYSNNTQHERNYPLYAHYTKTCAFAIKYPPYE